MHNNKESLQAVLERCVRDKTSFRETLDGLLKTALDPTHVGQWQEERAEIVEKLCGIFSQTHEISGTVETAAAITEYHRSVVAPVCSNLVHALIGCEIKLQQSSTKSRSTEAA